MQIKRDFFWNNKPFWFVILLAIALLLNFTRLISLKYDTNVTFLGMLSIWLLFYCLGLWKGGVASIIVGLSQFAAAYSSHAIFTSDEVSLAQQIVVFFGEYILAYVCFGGGLLFARKRLQKRDHYATSRSVYTADIEYETEPLMLIVGFLVGVLARYIIYVALACLPFYMTVSGDTIGENFLGDFVPLAIETVLTMFILCGFRASRDALYFLKHIINNDRKDETLVKF